ncbi:IclR family transcriptional regulator [Termitidicoccus mucosus]|uniref:Transcriptional regulator n=1 Tax=Termitidicoccus mucosus TaxID=1184151 RepID=A0A178IC03_9BACT|nr:transcriptional regulator [Opitutaceae bacterium TSB47]
MDALEQKTTLSQGLKVMHLLARSGKGLGVTQVAQSLGLPKSSAHRLLTLLGELGFVRQNPQTKCYGVSPRIFGFVHEISTQFGANSKVDPLLREAATRLRCSAYLCMLDGKDTFVVCAAGVEGNTIHLGTHGPVYATSAGKVLVAHRLEEEWNWYAPEPDDEVVTEHTSLDPGQFYQQLRVARQNGVAWNMRESTLSHASVATPVREPGYEYPRMAAAFVVRYTELPIHDRESLADEVRTLAAKISSEFGYRR